jgi:hypothetical protein
VDDNSSDNTLVNNNPCSGKTKRQCKIGSCAWDVSTKSCVLFGQQQTKKKKPMPTANPTSALMVETVESDTTSSPLCEGKKKKQCAKVSECGWSPSKGSCVLDSNDDAAPTKNKTCHRNKWHPLTASERICTNAADYPLIWNEPLYAGRYLLNSGEECCRDFYSGGACQKVDVCD